MVSKVHDYQKEWQICKNHAVQIVAPYIVMLEDLPI